MNNSIFLKRTTRWVLVYLCIGWLVSPIDAAKNRHPAILSVSKKYIVVKNQADAENAGKSIRYMMEHFSVWEKHVASVLKNDNNPVILHFATFFSLWGNVYVELLGLIKNRGAFNEDSLIYAVALIYAERYHEAITLTQKLISDQGANEFGGEWLLGYLSMQDKSLFSHMEKAFELNPLKAIYATDWATRNLPLKIEPHQEWDFIDAYMNLIFNNLTVLASPGFHQSVSRRLTEIKNEKYYDSNHSLYPEFHDRKNILNRFELAIHRIAIR